MDVGTTPSQRTVTVSNVGAQALTIGADLTLGVDDPGDFAISHNTCAAVTLACKESCTLKVAFTPSADGARTARIEPATNEPTSSAVKLSGIGVGPVSRRRPARSSR